MSLSPTPPVKITFSTAQDISDEILGGAIQFCKETGCVKNTKAITFLWSAFLFSAKDAVCENGILEDVLKSCIRSISRIFPKLSEDGAFQADVNKLRQLYWTYLTSNFEQIKNEAEINAILHLASKLNTQDNSNETTSLKGNPAKIFVQVSGVVRSNIYSMLHQLDNSMSIQYKYIVDHPNIENYSQQSNPVRQENTATSPPSSQPLGMGWYNFLVKFGLVAGAIINFIVGICYLTGGIYEVQSDGLITAQAMYAYYDGLQALDVIHGFLLIGLAIFGIVVRSELAQYQPDAPKLLNIFYGVVVFGAWLYPILFSSITFLELGFSDYLSAIGGSAILIINYKYFSNRANLFIGNPPATQSDNQMSEHQEFTTSIADLRKTTVDVPTESKSKRPAFCRKCGNKLTEDSLFCDQCGAKIMIDTQTNDFPS